MAEVAAQEVRPGLVVHLDTAILRNLGGSQTNAEKRGRSDRAVQGPHYFLILDVEGQSCIAAPLFSKSAPGSEPLIEARKDGLKDKWVGDPSYFSRWQHWRIPLAAIPAASTDEESTVAIRRTYASEDCDELRRLLAWKDKNRSEWRAL